MEGAVGDGFEDWCFGGLVGLVGVGLGLFWAVNDLDGDSDGVFGHGRALFA